MLTSYARNPRFEKELIETIVIAPTDSVPIPFKSMDNQHLGGYFRIEEGTYGIVFRAQDKRTNEIVALKRLKMEREKEGFPITSLREVSTLLKVTGSQVLPGLMLI